VIKCKGGALFYYYAESNQLICREDIKKKEKIACFNQQLIA